MSDFWEKECMKAEREKSVANFKLGWLCSCLRGAGVTDEVIKSELAAAEMEARKYLK